MFWFIHPSKCSQSASVLANKKFKIFITQQPVTIITEI